LPGKRLLRQRSEPVSAPGPEPVPARRGVTDLAADQPANPANTITYTLDVTSCLAALGFAWNPGEEALINFWAVDGFYSSSSQTDMWAVFTRR